MVTTKFGVSSGYILQTRAHSTHIAPYLYRARPPDPPAPSAHTHGAPYAVHTYICIHEVWICTEQRDACRDGESSYVRIISAGLGTQWCSDVQACIGRRLSLSLVSADCTRSLARAPGRSGALHGTRRSGRRHRGRQEQGSRRPHNELHRQCRQIGGRLAMLTEFMLEPQDTCHARTRRREQDGQGPSVQTTNCGHSAPNPRPGALGATRYASCGPHGNGVQRSSRLLSTLPSGNYYQDCGSRPPQLGRLPVDQNVTGPRPRCGPGA